MGLTLASLLILGGAASWAAQPVPTVTGVCTPILTSSLSPTGGVFNPGDVIHFTITLAVPSVPDACTLDNVDVVFFPPQHSDLDPCDFPPGGVTIATGLTLTPGTSFSWNGSDNPALDYVVPPGDAGFVIFAGTAFPFHVVGSSPPLNDCDEKTVQNFVECPKPCIQVTKRANCDVALVGDEIVYSVCVRNCGENDLNNVVVTDDLLGTLPGFPSTLIAGQEVCLDFPRDVQPGDPDPVVNVAHASGIDACDKKTPASDDSDPVSIDILHPAFTVTKTCVSEPLKVGDTASFEVVITNTGDVGLDLTTNDAEIPPFGLAVGAHHTQTVTEGPATFPAICDTIVVNGMPQEFCYKPAPIEHRASDCCDVGCPPPCIQVTKEANCDVALVGDQIVYSVCVRNCGKNDLNNVVVTDDLLGPLAGFPSTLTAGQQVCLDFPRVVQAGDPDPVVNIAHASGVDACDGGVTPASDDSEPVSVDIVHPAFTVTKTCVSEPLREGDMASFEIVITNTGDVGLNVSTNDPEIPPFSLAVGANHTQTVTEGPVSPPAVCDTIQVTALPQSFCEKPSPIVHSASDCCDVGGQEGCTPGFWKNHPDCWCDAYNPDDLVGDVFDIPSELSALADDTLMDALNYGGGRDLIGKARNLLRHGVAALLNACNDNVAFPTDVDGVIDMVNDALATLDPSEITRVQGILAGWNQLGCPIDAHCRVIDKDSAAGQQSASLPKPGDASLQSALQANPADAELELFKPMPNPFTSATRLAYEVGAAGDYVKIEVYSATGRRVRTLANGQQSAGRHVVTWDGRSDEGQQVAGGVYFYHAVVGSRIDNLRVIYIR